MHEMLEKFCSRLSFKPFSLSPMSGLDSNENSISVEMSRQSLFWKQSEHAMCLTVRSRAFDAQIC